MSKEEEMTPIWAAQMGFKMRSHFISCLQFPLAYKKMMVREHIFGYDVLDDHDLESKCSKEGKS